MTQALEFLDHKLVRDNEGTEHQAEELRRIVDVYRYCDVSASWEGSRYDRPGVFYVLEGDPHRIVWDRGASRVRALLRRLRRARLERRNPDGIAVVWHR